MDFAIRGTTKSPEFCEWITTMYIQLHMIKQRINSPFIVLHTCTHRHFIHDIVRWIKIDAPLSTKDNTLFNLFWWEVCAVQSARFISFNYSCSRFFRHQIWLKMSNCSLYNMDSGTDHHNTMIFWALCWFEWAASSFGFVLPPASAVT